MICFLFEAVFSYKQCKHTQQNNSILPQRAWNQVGEISTDGGNHNRTELWQGLWKYGEVSEGLERRHFDSGLQRPQGVRQAEGSGVELLWWKEVKERRGHEVWEVAEV